MKSVYSFADQVFSQHGVESRPAVSPPGIRRLTRAFELQVIESPLGFHLPQQYSTTITKAGKMPKLMPGVSLSDGLASGHLFIARKISQGLLLIL